MKWKGPGPGPYPDPTSWTYPPSAHTHTQQSWFSSSRSAWLVFAIYTSLLILLFCLLLLFVAIEQIGGERLLSEIPVGFLQTTPITRWLMSTLFSSVCVLRACVCVSFYCDSLMGWVEEECQQQRGLTYFYFRSTPPSPARLSLSFCVCAFPSPHSMSFFLSRNHFRCHLLGSLIILFFFFLFILLHSCGFYWHSRLCAAAVSVDIKSSSSSSRNLLCRPPLPPPPPQESKNFFCGGTTRTNRSYTTKESLVMVAC